MPTIEDLIEKLDDRELDLLQDLFGLDLRDPNIVENSKNFLETRRRIVAIEERALRKLRKKRGEDPHCSFCDGLPNDVGKLCESPRGPFICEGCATTVLKALRDGAQ